MSATGWTPVANPPAGWTQVATPATGDLPIPDAVAQARAQTAAAIPTMAAINTSDTPADRIDSNKTARVSPYTAAGARTASIGEGYNEYMRQSGVMAGAGAGAGLAALGSGVAGATGVAARALAAGAGAGGGSIVGGATPKEAAINAAVTATATPVLEGAGALVKAGVKKLFDLHGAEIPETPVTDEWRKINDVLKVGVKDIRIGENATDLAQAATMPGRALAKAGLTSDQLATMTPIERQAAIQPIRQKAAADLNAAFQAAQDNGTVFDTGKSSFSVLQKIKGPAQQKAIDEFNNLAQEVGITNQRTATPLEVRDLRQALAYSARFGQGGDLSSLGSIRAELYRAVNRDLHGAVPGLQDLDQFYSDVKGASNAARNSVAKEATKAPEPLPPTMMQRVLATAKKSGPEWAARGAIGLGGGTIASKALGKLSELVFPGNP